MSKEAMKLALEMVQNKTYAHAEMYLTEALAKQEHGEPVARVAEVHMSRYTLEWTNGPLPEGTELFKEPQPAQQKQGKPVAALFEDGSIVKMADLEFVPEKSGQRVQMLVIASQTTQQNQPDLDAICQDLQEKTYTQAMRIAELEEALAKQEQKEDFFKQIGDQSMMQLWQNYCDVKVERDELQEKLAKQEPVSIDWGSIGAVLFNVWYRELSADEGYAEIEKLINTHPQPAQPKEPLTDEQRMAEHLGTDVETYQKFKKWLANGFKE